MPPPLPLLHPDTWDFPLGVRAASRDLPSTLQLPTEVLPGRRWICPRGPYSRTAVLRLIFVQMALSPLCPERGTWPRSGRVWHIRRASSG